MASPPIVQRTGPADWALMTAIHDALRRDLDALLHTTASRAAARDRWITFRDQLHLHLAAERTALWPRARAKLAGDPHGQVLLDAMEDEHQLIGPLQAMTDDAFAMDADPGRLRQLLTRLRTRLASHLAHEDAEALPLIGQIMSPRAWCNRPGHPRRACRVHGPVGPCPCQPSRPHPGTEPTASAGPPVLPEGLVAALHPQLPAAVNTHQAQSSPVPPAGSMRQRIEFGQRIGRPLD